MTPALLTAHETHRRPWGAQVAGFHSPGDINEGSSALFHSKMNAKLEGEHSEMKAGPIVKRMAASVLFVTGGVATWVVLHIVQGFGASQAGMSAASVRSESSGDAVVIYLSCSYFVAGALGAMLATDKRLLWIFWSVAHCLLAAALCILCSEASAWGAEKFFGAIIGLAFLTGILISPWLVLWAWLFRRAGTDTT